MFQPVKLSLSDKSSGEIRGSSRPGNDLVSAANAPWEIAKEGQGGLDAPPMRVGLALLRGTIRRILGRGHVISRQIDSGTALQTANSGLIHFWHDYC